MISNSQGVCANGGSSTGGGTIAGRMYAPEDVRDACPAPLWFYFSPMQLRR